MGHVPPLEVHGPAEGDLLVLGWGSTYGAIRSAVERLQSKGASIAHAHLRYLNPFPANTGDVLKAYKRVLIPDRNKADLEEVPREVRDEMEFVFVDRLDEVLAAALESVPQPSQAYLDALKADSAQPSTN